MSDAVTISSGPGETWRPTGEVRYIQRSVWIGSAASIAAWEKWQREAPALEPNVLYPMPSESMPLAKIDRILQQRWASDAGADEWRDVPTVEG